ncbi:MAG: UDP-GlcNAc--UDP-phosphate GlcNAc-1-phosphate transferase, partial [Anditalea sp.]
LGYFMVKTLVFTHNPFYLLFFTVYGVDAFFTILFRLSRKENIFLPHRTHLYQYLANELEFPHFWISAFYALIQMFINLALIYWIGVDSLTYLEGVVFVIICCLVYLVLRITVIRRINSSLSG